MGPVKISAAARLIPRNREVVLSPRRWYAPAIATRSTFEALSSPTARAYKAIGKNLFGKPRVSSVARLSETCSREQFPGRDSKRNCPSSPAAGDRPSLSLRLRAVPFLACRLPSHGRDEALVRFAVPFK